MEDSGGSGSGGAKRRRHKPMEHDPALPEESLSESVMTSMIPERHSPVRSSLTVGESILPASDGGGKESAGEGALSSSTTEDDVPYKPLRPTRIDIKAIDVRVS